MRKLLTWATFWISDFEEGGAAELGGGADWTVGLRECVAKMSKSPETGFLKIPAQFFAVFRPIFDPFSATPFS